MYICVYLHAYMYSYIYMYILGWKYHIHRTHTYIHQKTRTVVWRFDSSTYGLRMCTRMCFRVVVYADYIADGGHRLLEAADELAEEKLRLRKKKKNRDRKLRQRRLETGSNPRVQSAMSNLTVWPASPDSRIEPASPSSWAVFIKFRL